MRDIKFRAWGVKSKVMVTVGELHWTMGGLRAYGPGCYIETRDLVADDNIILMQDTGLRDANGWAIYEGDILEVDGGGVNPFRMAVGFEHGGFVALAPWVEKGFMPELKYYINMEFCTTKVIGNIYENPELAT